MSIVAMKYNPVFKEHCISAWGGYGYRCPVVVLTFNVFCIVLSYIPLAPAIPNTINDVVLINVFMGRRVLAEFELSSARTRRAQLRKS